MVIMLLFLSLTLGAWLTLSGHRSASLLAWLVTFCLIFVSITYHMTDSLNISL